MSLDLHASAPERVDSTPAPRDVEQLEMADASGKCRVDDEMVS
jgi:hypothetical protein